MLFFCNCATVRFKGQFITANNKEYNNNDLNENQKNNGINLIFQKMKCQVCQLIEHILS